MRTHTLQKLIALLLAVCLLATALTACGGGADDKKTDEKSAASQTDKDSDKEDKNKDDKGEDKDDKNPSQKPDDKKDYTTDTGFLFYRENHVELEAPDKPLNPQEVYDSLTYVPEMFYGNYMILGGETAEEEFGKNSTFVDCTLEGKTVSLSVLPFGFLAGRHSPAHSVVYIDGYHWMYAYFMRQYEDGQVFLDTQLCAYTVEDNILTLRLLDSFYMDQDTEKITYAFSDVVLEYAFSFCGRQLTLSKDGASITLWAGLNAYNEENYIHVDSYLVKGTQPLGNVDSITFSYADDEDFGSYFFVDDLNDDTCYNGIAHLEENGLFTMTIPWEEGKTDTYQMVYFLCGDDGIIFTDGTSTYFYTHNYSDRNKTNLQDYITEDQTGKMDELDDNQMEEILNTKTNLLKDLEQAFKDEGINVTVNVDTGEMTMDASVLFGGDSAVLTDAGKEVVRRFVSVYTSVAFADEYEGFISHTMVEGHAAPTGLSYEQALPLSEERANVVRDYCLSLDNTLEEDDLEAIGYSNSKPIKDKDGKVDMAASRRVSFRFIIDLDSFID